MDAPAAHPTVRSHIELMGSCEDANPLPDAVVDILLQMLTGHQMVAYNQLDTKWCPIKPDMR
jgi:hypothetical protein